MFVLDFNLMTPLTDIVVLDLRLRASSARRVTLARVAYHRDGFMATARTESARRDPPDPARRFCFFRSTLPGLAA